MACILRTIVRCLMRRLAISPATEADLLALKHQVVILQRQSKRLPKLSAWDQALFATQNYAKKTEKQGLFRNETPGRRFEQGRVVVRAVLSELVSGSNSLFRGNLQGIFRAWAK